MSLDLSSLEQSIDSLSRSISSYTNNLDNESLSVDDIETLKAGVIQNFEVSYEVCWKYMKRWIEVQVSPLLVDGVSRRELYRVSAENHLINEVEAWMDYHNASNLASHTYSSDNAANAFKAGLKFVHDAKKFLSNLKSKND